MKILCTLLRSALLYKQWFGSDSPLSPTSQGGQDAFQVVKGRRPGRRDSHSGVIFHQCSLSWAASGLESGEAAGVEQWRRLLT